MLIVTSTSCQKEEFDIYTTSDVNITEYLAKHPESFSQYSKILAITKAEGSLAAYGTYTSFVPTNDAIDAYLRAEGKSSVNDFSVAELEDLVRFHLIRDTIPSVEFSDGKLRTPTMFGQYIITGAQNTAGSTRHYINRQALLLQGDIRLGNGIVHVIDNVLRPSRQTLAEMVSANPDFSIFSQALKETGYYDYLNVLPKDQEDSSKFFHTVLVESNQVLSAAGINSYDALKSRYSNTGNPASPEDSLHLYIGYHILPGLKYLPDVVKAASHTTLSPQDVITTKLNGTTILVNEDTFNGVREPGAEIKREGSDVTAANGVLHVMKDPYKIKIRFPIPIYWEVTDQPEITKLANYRKGNSPKYKPGDLQDVNWEMGDVQYIVAPQARQFYVYHNDYLFFPALRTNVNGNGWIEFKTPLLVKGKYKVWISFIRRKGGGGVQISFNGKPLPRILKFNEQLAGMRLVGDTYTYPEGVTPESLEALGIKSPFGGRPEPEYRVPFYNNPELFIEYHGGQNYALLAGTIDVEQTDRHTLRMDAVWEGSGDVQFDMIHFIPENEDQLWPKFNPDGTIVPKP